MLRPFTLIDDTIQITSRITAIEAIIVEIDLVISLITTDLTITIVQILEIYTLFARDQIADLRSIYKRNKMQKRLDLRLKTSIDL